MRRPPIRSIYKHKLGKKGLLLTDVERARLGRPRTPAEIEQLVVKMANENGGWGSYRITGALANLGR